MEPLFYVNKKKGRRVPVDAPCALAPLADTHGHLTVLRRLNAAEAIARAALVGVRLLVVPVDPAEDVPDVGEFLAWFDRIREEAASRIGLLVDNGAPADALDLVEHTYFVAGVHPYGAKRFMEDAGVRSRFAALLDDDRCVGVGEFGLDIGPWSELGLEEQLPAFREHVWAAHERNLPVELHIRDGEGVLATAAHDLTLEVLKEEGVPTAGCDLHCFTSGPEVMKPFVDLGCYIAFGGAATFGRSTDIRAAIAACPASLLLSETDSPYMAPVPLRGQECEPAMVAFSAHNIARVRAEAGISNERETYEALWRNACTFFGARGLGACCSVEGAAQEDDSVGARERGCAANVVHARPASKPSYPICAQEPEDADAVARDRPASKPSVPICAQEPEDADAVARDRPASKPSVPICAQEPEDADAVARDRPASKPSVPIGAQEPERTAGVVSSQSSSRPSLLREHTGGVMRARSVSKRTLSNGASGSQRTARGDGSVGACEPECAAEGLCPNDAFEFSACDVES